MSSWRSCSSAWKSHDSRVLQLRSVHTLGLIAMQLFQRLCDRVDLVAQLLHGLRERAAAAAALIQLGAGRAHAQELRPHAVYRPDQAGQLGVEALGDVLK